MGDISIQVTSPGLTEETLRAALLAAPEVAEKDADLLLGGRYRIALDELDPGVWEVELVDYLLEGAEFPFDRLYDHLERTTSWGLWANYIDLLDYYAAEGIYPRERPVQVAA